MGQVTQVIGAVVDVQFDKDLPPIFNALEVRKGTGRRICNHSSSASTTVHIGQRDGAQTAVPLYNFLGMVGEQSASCAL